MKLLVISWQPLYPVNSGYRRRVTELFGALSKHLEVLVAAPGISGGNPLVQGVPFPSTWRSHLPKGRLWETFSPHFSEAVAELAINWKPDLVLAEGLWAASAAQHAAKQVNASFGVTVQNIESESARGVYPFPVPEFLRSFEKKVYRQADWLVSITEEESENIREMVGKKETPIMVVPNGAQLPECPPSQDRIQSIRSQWNLTEGDRVVLFIGRLDYPPNRKGLEWFSNEVYPRIKDQMSGVRWIAVGEPAPKHSIQPFEFVGFVDDLDAACRAADLAISPIRHGSGTSIKVLDLLSKGVPLVATKESVRGLGPEIEQAVIVANSPEQFSQSIQALLTDPSKLTNLSAGGPHWVDENWSWPDIARRLFESLHGMKKI